MRGTPRHAGFVKLTSFPGTHEGLIESFVARFPAVDDELQVRQAVRGPARARPQTAVQALWESDLPLVSVS